jgi:hypothetical protein
MSIDLALGVYGSPVGAAERPLAGSDVEAAHDAARNVLAVEVPAERAVWGTQVLALLLGGLAPLLGAGAFHWTLGPLLLAIAIDDAATLIADLLKVLVGDRAFTREIERRRVAANALAIARLVAAPADRVPLSWNAHPPYPRPAGWVLYFYGSMGLCFTGLFLGILLVFVDWRALPGWPLLFLPLLTRIVPAVRTALRARAGRPCPGIMPMGWLPASASILAILAFMMSQLPGDNAADPVWYAAWYFGICAAFAVLLAWARRRRESLLHRFADSDVAPVVAALRRARYGGE